MKALSALSFAAFFAAIAIVPAPAEPASRPSYYEVRRGLFGMSKIATAPIVMAGDSLIEAGPWTDLTGCLTIANRGIGGDTTKRLLERLDDVLAFKPRAVFLMVGVNDITLGIARDVSADNMRNILGRITGAGAQAFMTYVLPVAASYSRKSINKDITPLNAAFAKVIAGQAGVTAIDIRPQVMGADGFLREEFAYDGQHLTPKGYAVLRDAIAPYVAQYCTP